MGCPLLIGLGEQANFVASDVSPSLKATRRVVLLEEGDVARLTCDSISLTNADGEPVERPVRQSEVSLASLELGPYHHFMQKEIHECPRRWPTR